METPGIGSTWRNAQTKVVYRVLHIGKHPESLEVLVICQEQSQDDVWCYPLAEWNEGAFELITLKHKNAAPEYPQAVPRSQRSNTIQL